MSRSLKPVSSVATTFALQPRFKQGSESSCLGIGHVFRARVLDFTEACKSAESSSRSLYLAPFSLAPANVLLQLSKLGAKHAIVILSEKRALEFSNDKDPLRQTAILPFTSMAFHCFGDKMRQNAASPLAHGGLLQFQPAQFRELIKNSSYRPSWTFPPESGDEPELPDFLPTEKGNAVQAPSSFTSHALTCTTSDFYRDVFEAAEMGDLERLASLLVPQDAQRPLGSARHTASGGTPLHFLATSCAAHLRGPAPTLVSRALHAGGIREHGAPETFSSSALLEPQSTRLESVVHLLLAGGVDVNAAARNGSTALHWAAGAGNLALVRILLEHGANPYAQSYTWRCAEKGETRMLMLFVRYATLSCRREVYGRGSGQTPLHWAAESNHADVVAFLAEAAPLLPGTVDERGRTPRDLALREGASAAGTALLAAETTPLVAVEVCADAGCLLAKPVND